MDLEVRKKLTPLRVSSVWLFNRKPVSLSMVSLRRRPRYPEEKLILKLFTGNDVDIWGLCYKRFSWFHPLWWYKIGNRGSEWILGPCSLRPHRSDADSIEAPGTIAGSSRSLPSISLEMVSIVKILVCCGWILFLSSRISTSTLDTSSSFLHRGRSLIFFSASSSNLVKKSTATMVDLCGVCCHCCYDNWCIRWIVEWCSCCCYVEWWFGWTVGWYCCCSLDFLMNGDVDGAFNGWSSGIFDGRLDEAVALSTGAFMDDRMLLLLLLSSLDLLMDDQVVLLLLLSSLVLLIDGSMVLLEFLWLLLLLWSVGWFCSFYYVQWCFRLSVGWFINCCSVYWCFWWTVGSWCFSFVHKYF